MPGIVLIKNAVVNITNTDDDSRHVYKNVKTKGVSGVGILNRARGRRYCVNDNEAHLIVIRDIENIKERERDPDSRQPGTKVFIYFFFLIFSLLCVCVCWGSLGWSGGRESRCKGFSILYLV